MTAAELIEELKKVPGDTLVLVTDSSCCGCSDGPIDSMKYDVARKTLALDGDRYSTKLKAVV